MSTTGSEAHDQNGPSGVSPTHIAPEKRVWPQYEPRERHQLTAGKDTDEGAAEPLGLLCRRHHVGDGGLDPACGFAARSSYAVPRPGRHRWPRAHPSELPEAEPRGRDRHGIHDYGIAVQVQGREPCSPRRQASRRGTSWRAGFSAATWAAMHVMWNSRMSRRTSYPAQRVTS